MFSLRKIGAGVAVAAMLAGTPALADTATTGPVVVAATTVLSGTSSGYVDVRVPSGVTIEFAAAKDNRYRTPPGYTVDTPQDRMAGFALNRRDELLEDYFEDRTIFGHKLPADMAFDGEVFSYETTSIGGTVAPELLMDGPIPAGDYRLYLYTEPGVRSAVTLRFAGAPPGTLQVQPANPIRDFTVVRPPNELPAATAGNLFQAKAQRRYDSTEETGRAYSAVAMRGGNPGLWRSSACTYSDGVGTSPAYNVPTCAPAQTTVLASPSGGGSGGVGNGVFVSAGMPGADAFTRVGTTGNTGDISTATASVQAGGPAIKIAALFTWFDLAPR